MLIAALGLAEFLYGAIGIGAIMAGLATLASSGGGAGGSEPHGGARP